jgi:Raf kinase inhibitor-like YbhB/YbcL family protein
VRQIGLAVLLVTAITACGDDGGAGDTEETVGTTQAGAPATTAPTMTLTSDAFAEGEEIPVQQGGCPPGENVSPPLSWTGVPAGAEELALVMVDPDAGGFRHWTVLDIDPAESGFEAGSVPAGVRELPNDAGGTGYFGPCPPETHTYELTLYAVEDPIDSAEEAEELAVAQATLTGTYTPPG